MRRRTAKAQSAMEYLMTYGWAILIIAVVLGALFQLGVFNAGTFAPRAPPGACQVFRSNGPGSTQFINLEGVCSGELPQYVGVFNGQSGYVNTAVDPAGQAEITVTVWANQKSLITSGPGPCQDAVAAYNSLGFSFIVRTGASGCNSPGALNVYIGSTAGNNCAGNSALPLRTWSSLSLVYNGIDLVGYVNGIEVCSVTATGSLTEGGPTRIGVGASNGEFFNGSLANIQIYNTSLSQAEITALYDEGIGGAPVRLQNLVGWWPLNGNANDYSGNNNNGVPSAVTYTNQWSSGYTAP